MANLDDILTTQKNAVVALNRIGQLAQALIPSGPQDVSQDYVISTGSTTPRSLANRFANPVNPLDFGAKGDDVTDDTAAFNAAFAAGNIVCPTGKIFRVKNLTMPYARSIDLNRSMLRPTPDADFCLKVSGSGFVQNGEIQDPEAYTAKLTSIRTNTLAGATVWRPTCT